ncbi:MAG: hypothetical protein UX89_C0009G0002 [Parcubacteria group bacterium GW2011_GWA2_47_16]|nr:MAG: hypothetical protein UX89_C0009G0002 [Parcubacteria group bacterium GW2011_GWA2_47_16]
MSIVPILKSRELIKVLLKAGFQIIRQTGSHVRLEHSTDPQRQTSVPQHGGFLPRWLLSAILKQAGISVSESRRLLGKK